MQYYVNLEHYDCVIYNKCVFCDTVLRFQGIIFKYGVSALFITKYFTVRFIQYLPTSIFLFCLSIMTSLWCTCVCVHVRLLRIHHHYTTWKLFCQSTEHRHHQTYICVWPFNRGSLLFSAEGSNYTTPSIDHIQKSMIVIVYVKLSSVFNMGEL